MLLSEHLFIHKETSLLKNLTSSHFNQRCMISRQMMEPFIQSTEKSQGAIKMHRFLKIAHSLKGPPFNRIYKVSQKARIVRIHGNKRHKSFYFDVDPVSDFNHKCKNQKLAVAYLRYPQADGVVLLAEEGQAGAAQPDQDQAHQHHRHRSPAYQLTLPK